MLLTSLSVKLLLFPSKRTEEMLLVTLLWRLLLLDLDEVGLETTRLTFVGLEPPLVELAPGEN